LKSQGIFLLMILVMASLMTSLGRCTISNHIPKLGCGGTATPPQCDPFMAGYMDTDGVKKYVEKIGITVSFPETDPSVIQTDNWLAGGMFVTAYDSDLHQIDYGFYTLLVLEHDGSLYLDYGVYKTYECLLSLGGPGHPPWPGFPHGPSPWTVMLFNDTLPIQGVSYSTPLCHCKVSMMKPQTP